MALLWEAIDMEGYGIVLSCQFVMYLQAWKMQSIFLFP